VVLPVQGTLEVGAVGNLQHVRQAISAARLVLRHSEHTLLAGLQATEFVQAMVRTSSLAALCLCPSSICVHTFSLCFAFASASASACALASACASSAVLTCNGGVHDSMPLSGCACPTRAPRLSCGVVRPVAREGGSRFSTGLSSQGLHVSNLTTQRSSGVYHDW